MREEGTRKSRRKKAGGNVFEIGACEKRWKSTTFVLFVHSILATESLPPSIQKSARATTLLDSHSSSSKRAKKNATNDDEPEAKDGGKEIWDRDRDMSVTGRLMEDGARADVVKQAKELGERFGGGTYL